MLRLDQPARNRRAALRHALPFLAAVPSVRAGMVRQAATGGRRPMALSNVLLRHAARARQSLEPRRGYVVILGALRRRSELRALSCRLARTRLEGAGALERAAERTCEAAAGACACRFLTASPQRRAAVSSSTAEHLADLHVVAFLVLDAGDDTAALGVDLEIDLLGLELDDRFADFDAIALLLQPARDARFDDRFTELRNDDVGHRDVS